MDNNVFSKLNPIRVALWKELEQVGYERSKDDPYGTFSTGQRVTDNIFSDIISKHLIGKCLDIGCGLLSLPVYMENHPEVKFVGIDPLADTIDRKFEFIQAVAEDLPFGDEMFDSVLFATSLDHTISPELALKEACRVLKKNGKMFIWYSAHDSPHIEEKKFNTYHQWAFSDDYLKDLVTKSGFNVYEIINMGYSEHVLIGERK